MSLENGLTENSEASPVGKRPHYDRPAADTDVLRHSVSVNITQEINNGQPAQHDTSLTVTVSTSINGLRPTNVNVHDVKTDVTIGTNRAAQEKGANGHGGSYSQKPTDFVSQGGGFATPGSAGGLAADSMMPGVCKTEPRDEMVASNSVSTKQSETVGIDAELRDILDNMEFDNMQEDFLGHTCSGNTLSNDEYHRIVKSQQTLGFKQPSNIAPYASLAHNTTSTSLSELNCSASNSNHLNATATGRPERVDVRSQRNSTGSNVMDVASNVLIRPPSAPAPFLDGGPAAEALKQMAAHHQNQERVAHGGPHSFLPSAVALPPSANLAGVTSYPRFSQANTKQGYEAMSLNRGYFTNYQLPSSSDTQIMNGMRMPGMFPDQEVPGSPLPNVSFMQQQAADCRGRAPSGESSYGQMNMLQQQSVQISGNTNQIHVMQMQQMSMSSAYAAAARYDSAAAAAEQSVQQQLLQQQQSSLGMQQQPSLNMQAVKSKSTKSFADMNSVHQPMPQFIAEPTARAVSSKVLSDKSHTVMYNPSASVARYPSQMVPSYLADGRISYGSRPNFQTHSSQLYHSSTGQPSQTNSSQALNRNATSHYPPLVNEWSQAATVDVQRNLAAQQQNLTNNNINTYQQQRPAYDALNAAQTYGTTNVPPNFTRISHAEQQQQQQQQQQQMKQQTAQLLRPVNVGIGGGSANGITMEQYMFVKQQAGVPDGMRNVARSNTSANQQMMNFRADMNAYQTASNPNMWGASMPNGAEGMYR